MRQDTIIKGILTALLIILSIAFITTTRADAKARTFSKETDEAETDFRLEVKEVLKNAGARNAGITMTKSCEDGHTFNYKVMINLPGYIEINNEEKENLMASLEALCIEVADSVVEFSFS